MVRIILPEATGELVGFDIKGAEALPTAQHAPMSRTVFAAAHVVADPLATRNPVEAPVADWDATLAFRHSIWDLGLGVADAMDTAQRGMGLPAALVNELITRSCADARSRGAAIACGVGTDALAASPTSLSEITDAYLKQLEVVETAGGTAVVMASRALAASAKSPDDYLRVYSTIIDAASRPIILHWLGEAFDPLLKGYWGGTLDEATETVKTLIASHADKIDGIKISLLDAGREIALRRELPTDVRMYTGDDFNYPELIRGDDQGFSHALLGIFDPIAPIASEALHALDAGDVARYDALMNPTVALSRTLFEAPTYHYKSGIVFLAYLRGYQSHFTMLGGAQAARSILHYADVLRLADAAGLISDPDLAARRFRPLLQLAGIEQ